MGFVLIFSLRSKPPSWCEGLRPSLVSASNNYCAPMSTDNYTGLQRISPASEDHTCSLQGISSGRTGPLLFFGGWEDEAVSGSAVSTRGHRPDQIQRSQQLRVILQCTKQVINISKIYC